MKNFILLLLLVSTISIAQESTLLRFNYNTGDTYVMEMTMTQNMGETMSMNMFMELQTDVINVTDSVFDTEMRFKKIKMDMNQSGVDMSYDSEANEEDLDDIGKMMNQQMKPILETVLSVKSNNLGEVLEMKMIEGNAANADQFTNQTQNITYPNEAVKVGDSWTDEKENNGMIISSTYTVKSIDAKSVVLDIEGSISGNTTGTLTGDMNIDRESGISNSSKINMIAEIMGQKMISEIKVLMTKVE